MTPSLGLSWTLPDGHNLVFTAARNVGESRKSPDNSYVANLTLKMEDGDPDTDRFLFMSTLAVLEPVNGSNLTCTGVTGDAPRAKTTTIVLSGKTTIEGADLVLERGWEKLKRIRLLF